ARRGAQVILVSGPVHIPTPANVEVIQVKTALEMRDVVLSRLAEATIIVKTAAVADYYAANVSSQKLKKTAARISVELDPTPDILAEVGQRKGDRILVGFAAETQNLVEEARRKLLSKNCDMVVGNLVGQEGTGFEADSNEVQIVTPGAPAVHVGPADKTEVAGRILDEIVVLRLALRTADHSQ
ncbi:MAG: phosphopantothenoylcysteine decarboxylase, partial [Acidobacteriaceae bacterium]|nr:phosphopantothenoylcysteine decarboxylase [Acidobacteriaceae bacterium]